MLNHLSVDLDRRGQDRRSHLWYRLLLHCGLFASMSAVNGQIERYKEVKGEGTYKSDPRH